MKYYCCVHSQEALDWRREHAKTLGGFADASVDWTYVCGTKAAGGFRDGVLNAYDGNPWAKYNRQFRQFSSILHLLDAAEDGDFFVMGCTSFLEKIDYSSVSAFDVVFKDTWPSGPRSRSDWLYKPGGGYVDFMREKVDKLLSRLGRERLREFYMRNFGGFDPVGDGNHYTNFAMGMYVGKALAAVRDVFRRAFLPFTEGDGIEYFDREVAGMLVPYMLAEEADAGRLSYSVEGVRSKWMGHDAEKYGAAVKVMHYYGD